MNEELMKVVAEMRLAAQVERKRQYGEDRAITELDCDDWADRLEALAATTRGTEAPDWRGMAQRLVNANMEWYRVEHLTGGTKRTMAAIERGNAEDQVLTALAEAAR